MLRPTRPLVKTFSTRQLLLAELGAVAVVVVTCMADPGRAADAPAPTERAAPVATAQLEEGPEGAPRAH